MNWTKYVSKRNLSCVWITKAALCRHCQTETSAMPSGMAGNCPSLRLSTPASLSTGWNHKKRTWMFLMILLQNLLMRILAMVSFAWVCTAAPYAHRLTAHPAKLARIRRRLTRTVIQAKRLTHLRPCPHVHRCCMCTSAFCTCEQCYSHWKTELLENFLRGENIQNMLYGLYLERHKRMLIQQKRATLLLLRTGVFRRIIIDQLCQKTPLLKNTRASVDWAWINAEFSWCAGVEQIIFTPQDCNSISFFHAQIVALCPLVDVCVQHVAFLSAWSAGFAVGRWLLPAQTALLTATGQQRGQKTQPRTKNITHIFISLCCRPEIFCPAWERSAHTAVGHVIVTTCTVSTLSHSGLLMKT